MYDAKVEGSRTILPSPFSVICRQPTKTQTTTKNKEGQRKRDYSPIRYTSRYSCFRSWTPAGGDQPQDQPYNLLLPRPCKRDQSAYIRDCIGQNSNKKEQESAYLPTSPRHRAASIIRRAPEATEGLCYGVGRTLEVLSSFFISCLLSFCRVLSFSGLWVQVKYNTEASVEWVWVPFLLWWRTICGTIPIT